MNKEQQKQLIKEIMDLDAKDGLYDTVNETLYTEEDIDKLLSMYADDAPASYIKRDYKKYLQALKQPKKD